MRNTVVLLILLGIALSAAAAEFPDLPGWTPSGDVEIYGADDLWKRIDGAAELFVSYGFQRLSARDMSRDEASVAIEIYDMGSRLNAFGVYGAERAEGSEAIEVGVEGIVSAPYQCLLLKDRYYVKVETRSGEFSRDQGLDLLKSLDAVIPGTDSLPSELSLLPVSGRVERSERFVRESYFGLGELDGCLYAEYAGGGEKTYQIFAMIQGDASIEATWAALAEKWSAAEDTDLPILLREIPYRGWVGVLRKGSGIFGAAPFDDEVGAVKVLTRLDR